jgi:protein-S-isoprenylcysteine O-methyltransferase Ste14
MGVLLMLLSGVFVSWAFITMRNLGTSPDPRKPSTALSTNGAFAYSRNPIYVAMTGLYLGISLIINSLWLVLFLIPTLFLMQWGVIVREERYLSAQFGEAYTEYTQRVRRWL